MNRHRLIYIIIGFFLISVLIVFFKKYNQSSVNVLTSKTEAHITAHELTSAFINDEISANKIYTNTVIEITGIVKKITHTNNRNTIILIGSQKDSNVICDIEHSQLNKNMINHKIKIKGICKGLLKDVIMLNCILINTSENE